MSVASVVEPFVAARVCYDSVFPLDAYTSFLTGTQRPVHRERLCRADLRNRLVPAPPARHRVLGHLAWYSSRHVHGRHVSRQPAAAAADRSARASAARLRRPRARDRAFRRADPVRDAARWRRVQRVGRDRRREHRVPRDRRGRLSAAAHDVDGGNAARDFTVGEGDAGRCRVARFFLRRQHRGRRGR